MGGAALALAGLVSTAHGSGFALYEAGARGNALNGALVGHAGDASAVYHNPSDISTATNVMVSVGVTFINPQCDVEVNHAHLDKMNPGWFTIPNFHLVVPLGYGFTFGLGEYSEYGVGTEYGTNWRLAEDSYKTTVEQTTISPVVSYKVTDKWRVGGGLRASYFNFSSYQRPNFAMLNRLGDAVAPYGWDYELAGKLKGDDWGLGYVLSTSYDLRDNLHVGLVYRSRIHHKVTGHYSASGELPTDPTSLPYGLMPSHYSTHGHADATVMLPQSLAVGINWEATEKARFGFATTWTEWSSMKHLKINIPGDIMGYEKTRDIKFNWHDAFRFTWGAEYDLNDYFTIRGSYAYDMDPSGKAGTTMIPVGHRHIVGLGATWRATKQLSFDFSYTFVKMESQTRKVHPQYDDNTYRFQTRNAISHIVGVSANYNF